MEIPAVFGQQGGYGNFPADPFLGGNRGAYGGYNPAVPPYGGGYGNPPTQPANPYNGGYPANPSGLYPGNRGPYPPPSPDPYRLGGYPGSTFDPYGAGNAPAGPHVYQREYYPPATADPGAYGNSPIPPAFAAPIPGPSPVAALADQLVAQADGFLQTFAPTARVVPRGDEFLADATTIRDAAARLRQLAASGAPPSALTAEFGAIAATWQRMDARMLLISKGRVGPNIAKALEMGRTVEQIGGLLR